MVFSRGFLEYLLEIKLGEYNYVRGKWFMIWRKYIGFLLGCENKVGSYGKGNWNGWSNW